MIYQHFGIWSPIFFLLLFVIVSYLTKKKKMTRTIIHNTHTHTFLYSQDRFFFLSSFLRFFFCTEILFSCECGPLFDDDQKSIYRRIGLFSIFMEGVSPTLVSSSFLLFHHFVLNAGKRLFCFLIYVFFLYIFTQNLTSPLKCVLYTNCVVG